MLTIPAVHASPCMSLRRPLLSSGLSSICVQQKTELHSALCKATVPRSSLSLSLSAFSSSSWSTHCSYEGDASEVQRERIIDTASSCRRRLSGGKIYRHSQLAPSRIYGSITSPCCRLGFIESASSIVAAPFTSLSSCPSSCVGIRFLHIPAFDHIRRAVENVNDSARRQWAWKFLTPKLLSHHAQRHFDFHWLTFTKRYRLKHESKSGLIGGVRRLKSDFHRTAVDEQLSKLEGRERVRVMLVGQQLQKEAERQRIADKQAASPQSNWRNRKPHHGDASALRKFHSTTQWSSTLTHSPKDFLNLRIAGWPYSKRSSSLLLSHNMLGVIFSAENSTKTSSSSPSSASSRSSTSKGKRKERAVTFADNIIGADEIDDSEMLAMQDSSGAFDEGSNQLAINSTDTDTDDVNDKQSMSNEVSEERDRVQQAAVESVTQVENSAAVNISTEAALDINSFENGQQLMENETSIDKQNESVPKSSSDKQSLNTSSSSSSASVRSKASVSKPVPLLSSTFSSPPSASGEVFVSEHFRLSADDLYSFLRRHNLDFREDGQEKLIIRECPFCHPIKNDPKNMYKLYIWKVHGSYFCHRCGSKGSWFDFIRKAQGEQPLEILRVTNTRAPTSMVRPNKTMKLPTSQMARDSSRDAELTAANEQGGSAPGKKEVKAPDQSQCRESFQSLYARSSPTSSAVYEWLTGNAPGQRGIREDVLRLYGVGCNTFTFSSKDGGKEDHPCVVFPWISLLNKKKAAKSHSATASTPLATAAVTGTATAENEKPKKVSAPDDWHFDRLKVRSMMDKSCQRLTPSGGGWGWFGYHTIPPTASSVIITEGEFDAMAAYQLTGIPCISLPNGAHSLPPELLESLERFEKIYLWMDADMAGQDGATKFAKKIGVGRTVIVKPLKGKDGIADNDDDDEQEQSRKSLKDANDYLRSGMDISQILDMLAAAGPVPHEQIVNFHDLRDEVFRQFTDPLEGRGTQSKTLPGYNRILKGLRRGELTIVTGPTGVGKTTVLSQLSVDFCAQSIPTLWGSFEIKNARLAQTMLCQLAEKNFSIQQDAMKLFDYYADQFELLPMYFMRFFGSTNLDQVLDAMEYAVYVYDVEHIILDNLQFMLSGQHRHANERFDMQDRAVDALRHFATAKNVHITLVIHPRKEDDGLPLSLASVFGSAKATQEADNVLIIQGISTSLALPQNVDFHSNKGQSRGAANTVNHAALAMAGGDMQNARILSDQLSRHRYIDVKKNRFDGDTGPIFFKYDRNTRRIIEIVSNSKRSETKTPSSDAERESNQQHATDTSQHNGDVDIRQFEASNTHALTPAAHGSLPPPASLSIAKSIRPVRLTAQTEHPGPLEAPAAVWLDKDMTPGARKKKVKQSLSSESEVSATVKKASSTVTKKAKIDESVQSAPTKRVRKAKPKDGSTDSEHQEDDDE